jgi:UDP-N-acetylglucosamine 4-epimerase
VYANVFSRCYGLPTVGLRYFNVFGPRQDPNGAYAAVIPLWFKALLNGSEIVVNGDGQTSRDFCFVANVVQANLLAAGALDDTPAHVLNVAVGRRTTLLGLIDALRESIGRLGPVPATKVLYRPERDGDVKHSLADISRAVALIGYQPTHTLEQGLVESSTWYVRNSAVSSQLGLAR